MPTFTAFRLHETYRPTRGPRRSAFDERKPSWSRPTAHLLTHRLGFARGPRVSRAATSSLGVRGCECLRGERGCIDKTAE